MGWYDSQNVTYIYNKVLNGVAAIILAISCCTALTKLGSRRLYVTICVSFESILVQLVNSSYTLVSMRKPHPLAMPEGSEGMVGAKILKKIFNIYKQIIEYKLK